MKAEIGFVPDESDKPTPRLRLALTPQSQSDSTLLAMFAQQMGLKYMPLWGCMYVDAPEQKP